MYIIDTNIHAAYLLQNFENDELTKKYLELYNTITLSERIVPDFILGEFETFIIKVAPSRYRLNSKDTKKLKQLAFDYIHKLTHDCVISAPEIHTVQRARDIYFENVNTHYIGFIDCLILAEAEKNKYTIFTKDARMSNIAKNLQLACLDPQNANN